MRTSEQCDKITTALSKFQAGNPVAVFDRTADTGKFKYSYASYTAVLESLKPLAEMGVSWTHFMETAATLDNGTPMMTITTRLSLGEQWIETSLTYPCPVAIQSLGSAITYLKRYQLSTLAGISSDSDTDGNDVEPPKPATKAKTPAKPASGKPDADKASTYDMAVAAVNGLDNASKRIQFLDRAMTRFADESLTESEFLDLSSRLVGATHELKELTNYFNEVTNRKDRGALAITDTTLSKITNMLSFRQRQLEALNGPGGPNAS